MGVRLREAGGDVHSGSVVVRCAECFAMAVLCSDGWWHGTGRRPWQLRWPRAAVVVGLLTARLVCSASGLPGSATAAAAAGVAHMPFARVHLADPPCSHALPRRSPPPLPPPAPVQAPPAAAGTSTLAPQNSCRA